MEIDKKILKIETFRQNLLKESEKFLDLCVDLQENIEQIFNEKYKNNKYSMDGLMNFYKMRMLCKKNSGIAQNISLLLKRKFYSLKNFENVEEK